ncbi:hypothetical protein AJ79_00754 [Helicocarpus griseus UAMH5409]|uniref:Uncharacterized protein n=1 Tax=Helicocarpus griseus UAMH5409 TaxID=1447875 RepID=A0A2B7Y9E0_9EURO|nr:hypothetical protein AJ79_00754 [Helicocarpus griseus UAMH5409]
MADEGKKKEESAAAAVTPPAAEKKQDEQSSTTTVKAEDSKAAPARSTATSAAKPAPKEDENDSDFEDLDDVLDDFSKKPTTAAAAASQPPSSDQNATKAPESDLDENAFLQQLEKGMAEILGPTAAGGDGDGEDPDWDALAQKMAQGNMDPAEIMKMLMGDGGPGALGGGGLDFGGDNQETKGTADGAKAAAPAASSSGSGGASKGEEAFQETIRKTMERMQASGDKATAAAAEDGTDDMLMQLLKAMESGAGAGGPGAGGLGDDESLDKIFNSMMESLSNKEMLYDPMKELHNKFGPWLEENRSKVPKEDLERYELQATIVKEIVQKFDEEGYSDDKPEDRSYIWERMQKMQSAGSPPEALVPLPDEAGIQEALAGGGEGSDMPQCPQQ